MGGNYLHRIDFNCLRTPLPLLINLLFAISGYAFAQNIGIAVLEPSSQQTDEAGMVALFKQEITALFEGEHQIDFRSFPVDETASEVDIHALLDKVYGGDDIDYVLVLDEPANQVLGLRSSFEKPTFLPVVLNASLLGYPRKLEGSGKKNLFYLTRELDFEKELRVLQTVAPFQNAVLIIDPKMARNLNASAQDEFTAQAKQAGVNVQLIPFEGSDHQAVLASIPADADCVLYGAFPAADSSDVSSLIKGVNLKGLPGFSLSGEAYVHLGALATNNPDTDWERLARLTALRIQEIKLGAAPGSLPVAFETTNQLMINMATSRTIRIAPGFEVLSDAHLLHEDEVTPDRGYSLAQVARKAVDVNLVLAAQRLQAERAGIRVKEVRASLLPRVDSAVTYNTRKDSTVTRNGLTAEDSLDGTITLTQPLYKEKLWAAHKVEKYNALAEHELMRQVELDIIQSAVNAYLNILRSQTSLEQERYNLQITRENYRLAKTRVEVGDSNKSDMYRWQSELANAKQALLAAKSDLERQRQELNRLLNRRIDEKFSTSVETLDNPSLLINDLGITEMITNRYALEGLTAWFVNIGLERSPELKQLEANMAATKLQLESDRYSKWLPDANLTARYNRNFDETRHGGLAADGNDWTVGVTFSLPLYEGGAKSARRAQSRLALLQIEKQLDDTKNAIETEIRQAMEAVRTSFPSIDLANTSEEAAQKNYNLVADAYGLGQVSIVDLLDAQNALIRARETSMNSVYRFLIDLMNLQRATGAFDFFLTDAERSDFSKRMIQHIGRKQKPKNFEDKSE